LCGLLFGETERERRNPLNKEIKEFRRIPKEDFSFFLFHLLDLLDLLVQLSRISRCLRSGAFFMSSVCATFQPMTAAKFYFAYFWFSSASGGRETFA
jgi:hypothetical protein